jgi:hypothetical protein
MAPPAQKGWKQTLRHEFIDYLLTFVYLALYFGAFVEYRRLILAEYRITYFNYGFAVIQALILAKVVLIGDIFLGKALKDKPLAIPTLWNSFTFTIWVVIFSLLEHIIMALLHHKGVAGGLKEFMGGGEDELLARCMVVFFSFIPFFAFRQLTRVLGEGKLWNLFFHTSHGTDSPGKTD